MAIVMGTLYQALVEGGTSPESATKAAEEVADFQKQLADIRNDLAFIKALLGVAVAGVVSLVVKAFFL
ncbi:integrase [Sphingomonas profundi]|uniref:integrase n=1 Tax=Alterirhizorhabdus profundi TaxID=2681549 RepID=UPI0012E7E265|nr:integrase [Sphingomonas profundi]